MAGGEQRQHARDQRDLSAAVYRVRLASLAFRDEWVDIVVCLRIAFFWVRCRRMGSGSFWLFGVWGLMMDGYTI
jgi:hypothetical protein